MTIAVEVQYGGSRRGLPRPQSVRDWVRSALAGRRKRASLTVRFVDRREGRALNRRWRGKQTPTNVLSFPAQGLEKLVPAELGDIVICGPVVLREADEQGKSPRLHFAHLVIHGTLHLLGYDHAHQQEAKVMEAVETTILGKLGYPDPYTWTS